jgi:hypothetical protein
MIFISSGRWSYCNLTEKTGYSRTPGRL